MSSPKKLHLPESPAPLPLSRKRRVAAIGVSSTMIAGLAVGAGALAFFLFPILSELSQERPPVQVVASPLSAPEPKAEKAPSRTQPPSALPSAPPQSLQVNVSLHQPAQAPLPQGSPPQSQLLTVRATNQLEFLDRFAEKEEARLEKIAQEETAAREEATRKAQELAAAKARQAAEEARKAQELAAARAQQAAEESRRQKELASIQAEERRQRELVARQAAESNRQKALASQVASAPAIVSKKVPSYPTSARRAGQEGTARITATVLSNGKISAAYVSQSSGHQSLDKSALSAVKRWRFSPARNGLGQAISHQVVVPIPFQLGNEQYIR